MINFSLFAPLLAVTQNLGLPHISCIHTPEMFVLLKYFKTANPKKKLDIAYSTPFEYDFPEEPFTSYCSYYGNLKTTDLLGFGGISDGLAHSRMIIFLGFEGVLASKVTEDIQYEELLLVNNLPSFFPKYKDICVINNYDLLSTHRSKLLYVPANNPFEIFNFLDSVFDGKSSLCVAPLSTKPVALGVCLYAMSHKTLRIVYPTSEHYNDHRTNKVLNTIFIVFRYNQYKRDAATESLRFNDGVLFYLRARIRISPNAETSCRPTWEIILPLHGKADTGDFFVHLEP